MNLIYDKMVQGKTAQWLCNADVKHTMGYTPDLAKAMALLGNTNEAYGQIWNLPVDMNALNAREWTALFAQELNGSKKVNVLPIWMLKLLGVFVPFLSELPEMMYQFDSNYHFDCSKFLSKFPDFKLKINAEAVKETIQCLKVGGGK